ncbi:MAG TPA: metallophosphoesterase [Dehalococcoidia bacterium]|nr:metallophosphoesterase [Dehalococcoidia bacterium]
MTSRYLGPDAGPFDIIGDVHGCLDELLALLEMLGYGVTRDVNGEASVTPPEGRRAIFLGDLVNRGPDIAGVLRVVMGVVEAGQAYCLRGNHDAYLLRKLQGADVVTEFDLPNEDAVLASVSQLAAESLAFQLRVAGFIEGRPAHLVLDDGRLLVAHAGLPQEYHGSDSEAAQRFAVFGPSTRETATSGEARPIAWKDSYRGSALVVYGHYADDSVRWANNTVCLDTGCVYGGQLTALRYPEREVVSVEARRVYYKSRRLEALWAAQAGRDPST